MLPKEQGIFERLRWEKKVKNDLKLMNYQILALEAVIAVVVFEVFIKQLLS